MSNRHWCTECREECKVIDVDYGIGPNEFWGNVKDDKYIVQVSDCCEAFYTDVDPKEDFENGY